MSPNYLDWIPEERFLPEGLTWEDLERLLPPSGKSSSDRGAGDRYVDLAVDRTSAVRPSLRAQ